MVNSCYLSRAADALDVSSAPIGTVVVADCVAWGMVTIVVSIDVTVVTVARFTSTTAAATTPFSSSSTSFSTMANGADVKPMSAPCPEWLTTLADVWPTATLKGRTAVADMPFMDGLQYWLMIAVT